MPDESRIDRLTIAGALRLARVCLDDAKLLQGSGSRNASCLAEQALEQVIRAVATSESLHILRSDAHQLDKIVRQFPDDNPEKPALLVVCWLEAYATTFRYVQPSGRIPAEPDAAKLLGALSGLSELIERMSRHFEVDADTRSVEPAGTSAPPRR